MVSGEKIFEYQIFRFKMDLITGQCQLEYGGHTDDEDYGFKKFINSI